MVRMRNDPYLAGDDWTGNTCATCGRVPTGEECEGPPPFPRPCSAALLMPHTATTCPAPCPADCPSCTRTRDCECYEHAWMAPEDDLRDR